MDKGRNHIVITHDNIMSRLQIMNEAFLVILNSTLYHVSHHRDNHTRKDDNANYIYKTCNKNGASTDIFIDVKITESIPIYQQIQGKYPLVDVLFFAISLPIAAKP